MTLDEMKANFTGLVNRRDLTANTALVSTFMDQAIMRVQRELRVPAMEKIVDVTITADYDGLIIPNDLIELKEIRPIASERALRKDTLDRALYAAYTNGIPQIYSRQGGIWVLGPFPSVGDVIRVTYYAEIPAMVNGTDENVVTKIAWDLIVKAACSEACLYYNDKRRGSTIDPMTGKIVDGFEGDYNRILAQLQEQADADELGDDATVSPALIFPLDDDIDCEVIW